MERTLVLHCTTITAPQRTEQRRPTASGSVLLYCATLADLLPRLRDLSAMLDKHEQDRAERFLHDTDRERYLLGHGYLREVLGWATGQQPGAITFERGQFGKPTMRGTALHFNFSDTKDAVIVAIGREELGVDIETMHRRVDHMAVAEHYFTAEEIANINASSEPKRRFLDFWTRKEAILKASGVGIMDDLPALRVDSRRNEVRIVHGDFVRMAAPEYHVQSFTLGEGHLVSIATPEHASLALATH
ncbi:MAG: 4'-phosphopantetheinyl transferase superfamily protein [Flavobacteriales bacterium]